LREGAKGLLALDERFLLLMGSYDNFLEIRSWNFRPTQKCFLLLFNGELLKLPRSMSHFRKPESGSQASICFNDSPDDSNAQ
jgi:hypothetical protein